MVETRELNQDSTSTDAKPNAVLVVMDLRTNLMLLDILLRFKCKVDYASDNAQALKLLHDRHFDLVITAASTSARTDVELLRKMRTVRAHTKMIIVTDSSTPSDVVLALREHAFSYFTEPYSSDVMAEMIRMALEGPSWDDGIEVRSATPTWIILLARGDKATAERLTQFFHEMLDISENEKGQLAFAFREMLLNAVRYGTAFDPKSYVEISYFRGKKAVACRVKDPGQGFTLDELYHSAITNPIDDPVRHITYREAVGLPPGGYGILLSRHLVDELIYNEQGNEVLLVKYLEDDSPTEKYS